MLNKKGAEFLVGIDCFAYPEEWLSLNIFGISFTSSKSTIGITSEQLYKKKQSEILNELITERKRLSENNHYQLTISKMHVHYIIIHLHVVIT